MNTETMKLLSEVPAGEGRWWKVELIRNVATKPIRVTLMEQDGAVTRFVSTPLHHKRTTATPEAVSETAKLILQEVGNFADVVGEFPAFVAPDLPSGWAINNGKAHHFSANAVISDCGAVVFRNGDRTQEQLLSPIDCRVCASHVDAAHA